MALDISHDGKLIASAGIDKLVKMFDLTTHAEAGKFLLEIKSIKADIRPDAVVPTFAEEILKKRNLQAPVGEVRALPDSAYSGS